MCPSVGRDNSLYAFNRTRDAQLILKLLLQNRFPRIWVPSADNRVVRQLLWHRHRLVQARARIMNHLHAVALNEGLRCKKRLWGERGRQQLESLQLTPWASRRRSDLLQLLDRLSPTIAELTQAIQQEAKRRPEARRLMTHPGVGALTALAYVLIIGDAERFGCGKQVASYLGVVPLEKSSGSQRRLGHITKQGSSMLRFLLLNHARSGSDTRTASTSPVRTQSRRSEPVLFCIRLEVIFMRFSGLKAQTDTRDSPEIAMMCKKHRDIDWASRSPHRGV